MHRSPAFFLVSRTAVPLFILILSALMAGLFFGRLSAMTVLCLGLALLLGYHLNHLLALMRRLHTDESWLHREKGGIWHAIFDALGQQETEKHTQISQLNKELERFRSVSHAMPDGIIYLSGHDTIEWFNDKGGQHFGLDIDRDVKVPLTGLARQIELARYLQTQQHDEPLILQSPRRSAIKLSIQVIPFGNKQKILVSRDVTQIERLETMRRDFIANVSHELRTPLTVVGGFIETVIDGLDDLPHDDIRHFLNLAQEQSTRMQRLIGDLLTLSALETGAPPPHEERIGIAALLGQIHQEITALSAGRHRIEFSSDADGNNHFLLGNQKELHSAFANLAANAVRYTPDGGTIRLTWRLLENEATFSVSDNGIGIPAQHLPRLTERFFRVDKGRSRETGGTGLGLAIVKHVVSRHQATLHIDSKPGQGSSFSIAFSPARLVSAHHISGSNSQ